MEHRHNFDNELQTLKRRILNMGAMVEERVEAAIQALMERRVDLAERVANGDDEVNALQIEIDDRALKLLALQAPMATDLRLITSAMKINADLERIGDQAVNVAQNALKMLGAPPLKPILDLPRMAEIAQGMIRDSLDAFVRRDAAMARSVLQRDDEVDHLKDTIFRVVLTYMMADPGTIERGLSLILVSRNIERIADHATNIAEDVIFVIEARDIRHSHRS